MEGEIMTEPMMKWGAAVFISYYVIKELIKLINKFVSKGDDTSKLEDKLDNKVDKSDCVDFRTRIGKESNEHRLNINCVVNNISQIKEDVAFLRGKAEGLN